MPIELNELSCLKENTRVFILKKFKREISKLQKDL